MTAVWPLLVVCALGAAPPDEAAALRYRRPGAKAAEVELTETRTAEGGRRVTRRSERGGEAETLALEYDRAGRLVAAEAVRGARQRAELRLQGKGAVLKRGGLTDFFKALPPDPVVVTGPGGGEALQVLRQYDRTRGGQQAMAALLLDPTQPYQALKVTAERLKAEVIKVDGDEVRLDRYRLDLPGGPCTAWADGDGRAIKVQPQAPGAPPLVLEGFEEPARGLTP